ncbi:MAG TPA: oligosaccharide flippase family protein [Candidatus Syntrophosphaera sp.]|nr:oligosaccharide flippase family protein [Candidatus Syntrophosphaera sp.]
MAGINLTRNVLVSGTFRVLNMALMFVTSIICTRYLGVELKGQYSYLTTLVGFAWMALDLGISKTYPYYLRKDEGCLSAFYTWSFVVFALALAVLGGLGAALLPRLNRLVSFSFSPAGWWIFIALIAFSQLTNQLRMVFLGLDKVKFNAVLQVVGQVAIIALVGLAYFLVPGANRLYAVLLALLGSLLVITLPYLAGYARQLKLSSLRPAFLWDTYKSGVRAFLSSLFILLLIRADIVILKRLTGYSSVGIYSLSAHIVDLLQIAANMVGSLLLVKLADTADELRRWILMRRIFIMFVVFLGVANLVFALIGKPVIRLVYGAAFQGAYYSTLWLIPASFGLSLGSLFNTYLWSKGFPLVSTVVPLLALLLNIGLNFLLIPGMGIAGAALASSICYCLWLAVILLYEQKQSQGRLFAQLVPQREDWSELWQLARNSLRPRPKEGRR